MINYRVLCQSDHHPTRFYEEIIMSATMKKVLVTVGIAVGGLVVYFVVIFFLAGDEKTTTPTTTPTAPVSNELNELKKTNAKLQMQLGEAITALKEAKASPAVPPTIVVQAPKPEPSIADHIMAAITVHGGSVSKDGVTINKDKVDLGAGKPSQTDQTEQTGLKDKIAKLKKKRSILQKEADNCRDPFSKTEIQRRLSLEKEIADIEKSLTDLEVQLY